MGIVEELSARHQRLKARIHAFRMPLSKRGQIAMNLVYFSIPVIGGHYIMQWANGQAPGNLRNAGVLPESGEGRARSKTEVQNNALEGRLLKMRRELEDNQPDAGGERRREQQ